MKNTGLARDYLRRATVRVRALDVLFDGESWADVVRESQEIVELSLKGLLRSCGIDPPRIHDVSGILLAERDRLPAELLCEVEWLAETSRHLRRDRELAFYGAEDLDAFGVLLAGRRRGGAGQCAARGGGGGAAGGVNGSRLRYRVNIRPSGRPPSRCR